MSERRTNQSLRRLGITLALLIGAEALAQFVAWRVWSTEWVGPAQAVDEATVLLVGAGECYDEGVASREEAWPAQAVAALGHAELRLVSGAAPGRDSEDVLRRLPLQLSVERPARVVLCVGVEDIRRGQAAPVDIAELPGRNAEFGWRPRLLDLLAVGGDGEEALQGAEQLHGAWHFGDLEFRFEPDGSLWMGQAPALWTFGEKEIGIEVPGVGSYRASWQIEGQQLKLVGNFPGEQVLLMRGPNPGGAAALGADQIDAGRFDEAEWMLRPAVIGSSADLDAAVTLVELLRRAGRHEEAEPIAAQVLAAPDSEATAARRARLLLVEGRPAEALLALGEDLSVHVMDPLLLRTLRGADLGDATRAFAEAALRSADRTPDARRRRELAFIATELLDRLGDRAGSAVALCRGLAVAAPPPEHHRVPALARGLDEAAWEQATEQSGVDRALLAKVRAGLEAADARVARVLAANLGAAVELIRFYGAEPVFLDPDDDPLARAARRQVGQALGVEVVSTARGRSALAEGLRQALGR
jgi:hypothetical protein